jgi:nucleotide-binding universal stress UspA family protein
MFVVGYDDSEGAQRALEAAIELARPLGEPLVVAFAAQPPGRGVGDEYRTHLEALEERGRAVTGAAVARATEAGVAAEAVVADRKVVDLLLDLADEHSARAIVVGTYGESPLRGAVLGSTPHKLLHLSRVPVLAVPAGRTAAG